MSEQTEQTIPTKRSSRRRQSLPSPEAEKAPVPEGTPAAGASPAPTVPEPAVPEPAAVEPPTPVVAARPHVLMPLQPPPPAQPTEEPPIPNSPFHRHDVVQVLDVNSRHYGLLFMVGDVHNRKVHGYHLTAGLHKEYVTVEIQHCLFIGRQTRGSKMVRSAQPCSPKWVSDRGGRQQ